MLRTSGRHQGCPQLNKKKNPPTRLVTHNTRRARLSCWHRHTKETVVFAQHVVREHPLIHCIYRRCNSYAWSWYGHRHTIKKDAQSKANCQAIIDISSFPRHELELDKIHWEISLAFRMQSPWHTPPPLLWSALQHQRRHPVYNTFPNISDLGIMFAGDPKVLATILEDQLDCSILGAHLLLDVHLCGEKQQTKMTYRGWHYWVVE
jgi:hypothetical protein